MIDIRRSEQPYDDEPLTWSPLLSSEYGPSAVLVCAAGHGGTLESFEIQSDGVVVPSVICSTEFCSWHEHVRLVGWPD